MIRQLQFYLAMIEDESDKRKFEEVYYQYERLLFSKARKILDDHHLAEEAVQHAFLYVAKNIHKIGDPKAKETKSFLCMVVENSAKDVWRKEDATRKRRLDLEAAEEEPTLDFVDSIVDELVIALSSRPEENKKVILLRYAYKFNAEDIGRFMNWSQATAEKRITASRKMLAKALEEVRKE